MEHHLETLTKTATYTIFSNSNLNSVFHNKNNKKVFLKRANHHQLQQQQRNHFCAHHHKCVSTKYLLPKCIITTWMIMAWLTAVVDAAPPHAASSDNKVNRAAWPPLKHHDIWNDDIQDLGATEKHQGADDYRIYDDEPTHHVNYMKAVANDSLQTLKDFNWNLYSLMNSTSSTTAIINSLKDVNFRRQHRVIHLFPVPVDGECLSNDGRRTGTCFNAYECRSKGGQAKGECAHGFGVCCIYIANCNETINNNITYLVSPSFPSFMPNNITNCKLKIKLMNDDISQLRFDFYHFILGQPNRRTGVCDGDVFNVTGGPGGTFSLCGQNSGQHVYYDVGGRMAARQTLYGSLRPLRFEDLYPGRNITGDTSMEIEISLHFAPRFLPTRLWEIRIAQIPFSQRAPAGCLQYFTGAEGVFQTFNFADNGRHLANQNYRICMRQEVDMCSIVYQPCDDQSFRIGPRTSMRLSTATQSGGVSNNGMGTGGGAAMPPNIMNMPSMGSMPIMNQMLMLSDDAMDTMTMTTTPMTTATTPVSTSSSASTMSTSTSTAATMSSTTFTSTASTTTSTSTTLSSTTTTSTTTTTSAPDDDPDESSEAPTSSTMTATTATMATSTSSVAPDPTTSTSSSSSADDPDESSESDMLSTTTARSSTSTTQTTISTTTALSDDVEGSGDGDTRFRPTPSEVSKRPRPTSGGFDLLGFLRTAFELRFRSARQARFLTERQKRQFYSSCRDRITMPCIVEDFIGTGLGPLPGCEPVHCGMQFCSNGMWPCRIESTVTPFYVGIHFGDGRGKGSPEDNIGACLRYQQIQCM
ncbi:uncharacterized protein LOC133333321 [Musca vetustissima]|uniref:uncharacterized protein LOC133333321 n=1 Tax=Musca vetustissima TaxID=27455 RepID=UPI002AB674F5|nr:uncharacterized protein LOC133333321 [Musca vetustissima]